MVASGIPLSGAAFAGVARVDPWFGLPFRALRGELTALLTSADAMVDRRQPGDLRSGRRNAPEVLSEGVSTTLRAGSDLTLGVCERENKPSAVRG
jgi:hypothetical protein